MTSADKNRWLCIHGHFYQPPRENPWLNEIELQDSAYPYHDWNERITAECYARNTASRILNGERKIGDIINNYSRISFNFGATLLSWMERKEPETYAGILEADRLSQERCSGHGSALGQVYNHIIMPLASSREKRLQVVWGIRDFGHRFGRRPEGMWLAETAVDLETLDILAENDIRFTILAPHQAKRIRKLSQGGNPLTANSQTGSASVMAPDWIDVSNQRIDPRRAYRCRLPSGRSIDIFFYDGPTSRAVAFEGLLNNGEYFAQRLVAGFGNGSAEPQLVHIATDGESYGHHHRFGEMALSYCLNYIEHNKLARLTNYGEFLEKNPPAWEVEIIENSSWSCMHGVERWRADCGCCTGGQGEWNQKWRAPLRRALDWLRDRTAGIYVEKMQEFHIDPWAARESYIEVVLNRDRDVVEQFLKSQARWELSSDEKIRMLKLLEMQYNTALMYTSCGWFFDEISGLEAVQVLKYAARAVQLTRETGGPDLEQGFRDILKDAKSNLPEFRDGDWIYETLVKPSVVDLPRVAAHYAVSSLFETYPRTTPIYSYRVHRERYQRQSAGRLLWATGAGRVSSTITWEEIPFGFTVFHLGDHNLIGGVKIGMPEDELKSLRATLEKAFQSNDVPEMIRLMNRHFESTYSLWHLFRDEQQRVLSEILGATMDDIERSFRQIYEQHYPLLQIRHDMQVPLPKALTTVVEFVLNRDLCDLLERPDIDMGRLQYLVDESRRWFFSRDKTALTMTAGKRVGKMLEHLVRTPYDRQHLTLVLLLVEQLDRLNLEIDLWRAQNIYFDLARRLSPPDVSGEEQKQWQQDFQRLGDLLQIRVS